MTTIADGIATATATIGLVKSLKDLDHALDKAELKSKMVELYGHLAEVKMALIDANTRISELEAEISALKSGQTCPICNEGHLKVVSSRPHEHFAFAGVQTRSLECTVCGHGEDRMHDPSGNTHQK